jgi:hypothetical protein
MPLIATVKFGVHEQVLAPGFRVDAHERGLDRMALGDLAEAGRERDLLVGVRSWSGKKSTRCSSQAARIAATVISARGPERSTPRTSAPIVGLTRCTSSLVVVATGAA